MSNSGKAVKVSDSSPMDRQDAGMIIVVSAPSGSGKTSVLNGVMNNRNHIRFSVSVTTRAPRAGERDGIDYHFVSDEAFDDYIEEGRFAEWAEVYGARYGTLKSTIHESVDRGDTIILDTDTVGAFAIREHFPDAVLIFIVPPSPAILEDRLKNRGTESADRLNRRLTDAPKELRRMKEYDYIIINDDLEKAVIQVSSIIDAENQRSDRMLRKLTTWREYIDEK